LRAGAPFLPSFHLGQREDPPKILPNPSFEKGGALWIPTSPLSQRGGVLPGGLGDFSVFPLARLSRQGERGTEGVRGLGDSLCRNPPPTPPLRKEGRPRPPQESRFRPPPFLKGGTEGGFLPWFRPPPFLKGGSLTRRTGGFLPWFRPPPFLKGGSLTRRTGGFLP